VIAGLSASDMVQRVRKASRMVTNVKMIGWVRANRIWSGKLLVGSTREFSGQSTCRIFMQGLACRFEIEVKFLDVPIAVGHMSVIVIWSAQEQRSRVFGTPCGDVRAAQTKNRTRLPLSSEIGRKFQAVQAQIRNESNASFAIFSPNWTTRYFVRL
jgi:hypothetical protein